MVVATIFVVSIGYLGALFVRSTYNPMRNRGMYKPKFQKTFKEELEDIDSAEDLIAVWESQK